MANYRDPKVTPADRRGGIGRWIALAAAVVILAILLFWWLGSSGEETVVAPVEGTGTEGTATEGTATGTETVPAEPAQQ